ncbi:unnamed protein product [Adineta steineri]|uniref:Uncharacterized protein n=1 Tax=Adineta steineri TaxID=433720 RepID=A0A818MF42_9BILA|nr:unnamed protein product [Adineta steineri]CAF3587049.1 unnamed protein product [Adineta steineri]
MFWIFFVLLVFSTGNCILINKINNNILIGNISESLWNITQNQCICEMINSNGTISTSNYFSTNQTCQLFYTNFTSILIEFNLNSSLIFMNQSAIFIAQKSTSTLTSTTSTITTSTTPTTTATTSVTATPPCSPQSRSTAMLLNITQPTSSNFPSYDCYAYTWVATKASATLSFFFRQDSGGWMLDDINVYHGTTQLIINGGFETGNLNAWNYSGSCAYLTGTAYSDSSYAKTGIYYYYDRCMSYGDTISQTFSTVVGDIYVISFWLTNYLCCSLTEIANVTIT